MRRLFCCIVIAVAIAGCSPTSTPPDPAYIAEVDAWHAQRETRLAAEDGWLTLVGLHWLAHGANAIGDDPSHAVWLEGPNVPPLAGTFVLEGGALTLVPEVDGGIALNGQPLEGAHEVATDAAPSGPDVFTLGRLQFFVIARADRLGVRVKDPEAPTRLEFEGVPRFAVDESYRVNAEWQPYDSPRERIIGTAAGTDDTVLAGGVLSFELDGQALSLEPWVDHEGDRELFVVFADATSGDTTYGAGRFLSVSVDEDGSAIVDFNRAVNPPCAFTPYATCPLPLEANILPVAIEAGERFAGHH
jgi:uncharacterized protein (DUF1684 family)